MLVKGEVPPAPIADECVLHQDFFGCGLGFPLHNFVRGLLLLFGCQLHHLTSTRILHISNFITLCEYYPGMAPHFELFRHFLCIQVQTNGEAICDLGGVFLQLHPSSKFFPCHSASLCGRGTRTGFTPPASVVACQPSFVEIRDDFTHGSLSTSFPRTANYLMPRCA